MGLLHLRLHLLQTGRWRIRNLVLQLQAIRLRPGFTRAVQRLFLLAAITYVLVLLALALGQNRQLDWIRYLHAIALALLIYPLSILTQATAWSLLVRRFLPGSLTSRWLDLQVYTGSQLMKRLPGGVWYVFGRAGWYRNHGIPIAKPMAATGTEIGLSVITGGLAYLALRFLPFRGDAELAGTVVWVVGGVAIIGAAVTKVLPDRSSTPIGRFSPPPRAIWRNAIFFLSLGALYFSALLIGAIILALLAGAGESSLSLAQALRIWSLVAVVGAVVGIVPFGFGLRDITIASILSVVLGPAQALIITVLFRIVLMTGDVAWCIPIFLVCRRITTTRMQHNQLLIKASADARDATFD